MTEHNDTFNEKSARPEQKTESLSLADQIRKEIREINAIDPQEHKKPDLPRIANRYFDALVEAYCTPTRTKELRIDVKKMMSEASVRGSFEQKLQALMTGFKERGTIMDGKRITLAADTRLLEQPAPHNPQKPKL